MNSDQEQYQLYEELLALTQSRGNLNVAADASAANTDFRSLMALQNAIREERGKILEDFQRKSGIETDQAPVKRALDVLSKSDTLVAVHSAKKARIVTDAILGGKGVAQAMSGMLGTTTSELGIEGQRLITIINRKCVEIPEFVKQCFYFVIKRDGVSINHETLADWQNLAVESKTKISVPGSLLEKKKNKNVNFFLEGKIYTPASATTIDPNEVSVFVKLMLKHSAQKNDQKTSDMLLSAENNEAQIDISKLVYHLECSALQTGVSVYSDPHQIIDCGQECILYCFRFIVTLSGKFANLPGVIEDDSLPCDQERSGHQWRFINICGTHTLQNCSGYYRLCLIPKSIAKEQLGGYVASLVEKYPFNKDITEDIFGKPEKTQNNQKVTYSEFCVANVRKALGKLPKNIYSIPLFVSAKALGTVRTCAQNVSHVELNMEMEESVYSIPKDAFKALWKAGKNKAPNTFAPYSHLKPLSKACGLQCDFDKPEFTDFFTSNLEADNRMVRQDLMRQIVDAVKEGRDVDYIHIAVAAAFTAKEFISPVVCIDFCKIDQIPFECKYTDVDELMDRQYSGPLPCHCWNNTVQPKDFHDVNLLISEFFEKINVFPMNSGLNLAHLVLCMLKLLLLQYNMPEPDAKNKKKDLFMFMEIVSQNLRDQFKWKEENMSVTTVDFTIISVLMHVFLTIIRTLDYMYCVSNKLPVTCWSIAGYNRSSSVEDIFMKMKENSNIPKWSEAKIEGLPLTFNPAHVIMILAGWHRAQNGTAPESINCFELTGNLVEEANQFINHVRTIVQPVEYHPLYDPADIEPPEFQSRTCLTELSDENAYNVGDESIFTSYKTPENWGIPGRFINHGAVPVYERLGRVGTPADEAGPDPSAAGAALPAADADPAAPPAGGEADSSAAGN